MNAHDAITANLAMSATVMQMLLDDFSDDELLVRISPTANHIAWTLGHLITSEMRLLEGACPGKSPELPAGFVDAHANKPEAQAKNEGFATKQEYLALYKKQRDATLAALAQVSADDFDTPATGPIARIAPTHGALFILMANHQSWHNGQITALRRHLGKPVVI